MRRSEVVGVVVDDGEAGLIGDGLRERTEGGVVRDTADGVGEKGWRKEK